MTREPLLLTSADAATLLGVSPASVKRWADGGLLACVRTAGGHRRFRREDLRELQRRLALREPGERGETGGDAVARWRELLASGASVIVLADSLQAERTRLGSWFHTAEVIGTLLDEVGTRWRDGRLTILDEHQTSENLARAIARCADGIATPRSPRALLAAAAGEEHTLGLMLCELCLREEGYAIRWAGRGAPADELTALILEREHALVGVSASAASDARALDAHAHELETACAVAGATLLLGGLGPWPESFGSARRVRTFRELEAALEETGS